MKAMFHKAFENGRGIHEAKGDAYPLIKTPWCSKCSKMLALGSEFDDRFFVDLRY